MGIPFFSWFNNTLPSGFVFGRTNPDGFNGGSAWFVQTCNSPEQLNQLLTSLAPGLMSAALLFKGINRPDLLAALRAAMLLLPAPSVPAELRNALPEIFGNPTA